MPGDTEVDGLEMHWQSVRSRHASLSFDGTDSFNLDTIPSDWAVISINVTEDRNTMFISRHQKSHEPLVFCLPLDRQGRREGEEEEDIFTFEAASQELKDIIERSDQGSRVSKDVGNDKRAKIAWWDERYSLDRRMGELVSNMENCWLGAFKVCPLIFERFLVLIWFHVRPF